jgi:hypothetical protein
MIERGAVRTNLFVLAALRTATDQAPVRIRNVSPFGMLVESSLLPSRGTLVEVMRGSLSARGSVVWANGGKVGIKLVNEIDTAEWLPVRVNRKQSLIDEVFAAAKIKPSKDELSNYSGDVRDTSDLFSLAEDLNWILQNLLEDNDTTSKHCVALQKLDIASHKVRKLIELNQSGAVANVSEMR